MALTLAKLQGNLTETSFEYDGDTVNVKYRPSVYTAGFLLSLNTLQNAGTNPESITAIVDLTKQILAGWDVLGDDGQPWPITEENLRDLPLDFLASIMRAITEDVQVGKKTPRTSNAV